MNIGDILRWIDVIRRVVTCLQQSGVLDDVHELVAKLED